MSEKEVIGKSNEPQTIKTLTADLKNIGIKEGMVLLVHSSLSSIGWVVSGAVTVILALEKALGEKGTLVMPAFSGDLSDPSKWVNPPVPESWCGTIKETMPVFDPDLTPTRGVGKIPEVFRKQKGACRSNHPQVSFTARGRYAEYITRDHSLEHALGDRSPLGKIYELGGYVLLMGVGYSNSTSLHFAEYRADYPSKKEEISGAPLMVSGKRKWVDLKDISPITDDFENLGSEFIKNKEADIRTGYIGQAKDSYKELQEYFRLFDPQHKHEEIIFETLGYIDIQNMASRIRADILWGIGLMDTICPPSSQFAAYNKINSHKSMEIYPDFGHEVLPGFNDKCFKFMMELL